MRDWEENSVHVLESLKRIERKIDALDDTLKEHAINDERRMDSIDRNATKMQSDLKWHSRIASALGAVFAIIFTSFMPKGWQ